MADSVSEARKLLSARRTQLESELKRIEQALGALGGGRRRGRKPGPKPGSKRRGRPPGSGRKPGPKPKKR